MTFDEFQDEALSNAFYPDRGNNLTYPVLGIAGETGEIAEKVKKLIRDKDSVLDDKTRSLMLKEVGDVLWYLAAFTYELNSTLDEAARINLEKIRARVEHGTLKGDGDER